MADVTEPAVIATKSARAGVRVPWRSVTAGALTAAAVLIYGSFPLDTYTSNILIRAFCLAALVMTVDILWGYTGILTFGQSAFFGIGAYAAALTFTHYGFGPEWAIGALLIGNVAAVAVAAIVDAMAVTAVAAAAAVAVTADVTAATVTGSVRDAHPGETDHPWNAARVRAAP